jgi:hypothetical protein
VEVRFLSLPQIKLKNMIGLIMDTMTKENTDTLNANDRCDRCTSQAFVWVNGVSGDLILCRHHFLKHEETIRAYAFEVVDETWKINHKSESSA